MPHANRIAVVVDPWQHPYNGTVVSTRRFVAALEEMGYGFRIVSIDDGPAGMSPGFRQLSIPGVNGIINAMRAPLAKPDRELLRRLLDEVGLLHVQFPFFLGRAAITEARRLGIPVVCSFHVQPENILENLGITSRTLAAWLYRLFIRQIYDRADRVVAPSAFAARLLREHGLSAPVTVVSNGIPQRFFDVVRAPGAPGFRVLSVGRLAREKEHETIIRAVAGSRHRRSIELVLVGVGPRQRHLVRLAGQLGVNATIGWKDDDDLLAEYGRADLFVHAGTIELEGMSVLEAMASGNAVIISDSPDSACGTLLTDPRCRFKSGDVEGLTARIDDWLDDPIARSDTGQQLRRLAATRSHAAASAALAQLYAELLAAPAGGVIEAQTNGSS